MPRESSISYDQVAAICNNLKANSIKPSPKLIREHHGSGSLGTIQRLFQEWKEKQDRPIETNLTLPPAIQRAILEFMSIELAGAKATLETELTELQQVTSDLARENERQLNDIEHLENQLEEYQEKNATLEGQALQMETDLHALRDEIVRERQAAEFARTELAKAQLRLEAMPRLEQETSRLQELLDIERKLRTDAEREQASSTATADGLTARLLDVQAQYKQTVENLQNQLTEQKQNTAATIKKTEQNHTEIAQKLEADKHRLENELLETRRELKNAAIQIGKHEGVINTLQQQILNDKKDNKHKNG